MLLDISRLRTGTETVDRTYGPEVFAGLKEEFSVAGASRIVGTVRRDKGTAVVLSARVTSTLQVPCSRCLEPYEVPVEATVETRFVPPAEFAKATAESTQSGEMDDDLEHADLGLAEYRDETIDLGEVIREQFFLALPMKPLCQDACKGLCPVCGVNRNRETCGCTQNWVDPRLSALADLKKQ